MTELAHGKGWLPKPFIIGKPIPDSRRNDYFVIACDTSTGRPWIWGSYKNIEEAKALGAALLQSAPQEVLIMQLAGVMQRTTTLPVEFFGPPEFTPATQPEQNSAIL